MMETQSISSYQFPPGVRFHPSDEELIVFYLQNKVKSRPLPADVVGEIELYSYNPWDLPKKALFGDEEWYFFSPRDRKYPNGARPNRTAASGYWKATGTDKPILSSSGARIGVKKALVFYIGKPPSGTKTEWIMIEYRLPDTLIRPSRSKGSMRLDDWVLCRIKQKGNMSKNSWEVPQSPTKGLGDAPPQNSSVYTQNPNSSEACSNYFLTKDCHLLAKLLAAQDFPCIEADNTATSQSSIITSNATGYNEHDHGAIIMQDHLAVNNPLFASTFNLNGKRDYGHDYDHHSSPPPSSKRAMINLNKNHGSLFSTGTGTVTTTTNGSFYNQHQSNGDMCKLNLSGATMNLQELDVYAFAQRFLQ